MSQTASELVQVLHLEVLYITNVTQDITFLVAATGCVSHQEHGVDRHLHVTVGNYLRCHVMALIIISYSPLLITI